METVDFGGRTYEVRRAERPMERCSLCSLHGCGRDAPCMELPVGSYLWVERERRQESKELFIARQPGKGYAHGIPVAADVRGRVVAARKASERADDVAEREGLHISTVYKIWKEEGVAPERGGQKKREIAAPAVPEMPERVVARQAEERPAEAKQISEKGNVGATKEKPAEVRQPRYRKMGRAERMMLRAHPEMTNMELAAMFGVCVKTISNTKRAMGLSTARRYGGRVAVTDEMRATIREHPEMGREELARLVGLAPSTVSRLRQDMGEARGKSGDERKRHVKATEEHKAFIREHADRSAAWLAERTGLSRAAVSAHRRAMGFTSDYGRPIDEERKAFIRDNAGKPNKWLMERTGLSEFTITKYRRIFTNGTKEEDGDGQHLGG